MLDKQKLSERDICTKFITPAVKSAGWDEMTQIREEVSFTKGRIIVRGKMVSRGQAKRADYVLYYKPNIPLAIIEAKDNTQSVGAGIQQGLEYAETLDIPFVFASNGDGFVFHDRTGTGDAVETNLSLDAFPSPDELWRRYAAWKGLTPEGEEIVLEDYYDDGSGKQPRYYQVNAVNAAMEAIAKGQNRVLLVMATGTGKTYTAFQIIWRLWKGGHKKRVLFLADRNILVDQTMVNDFRPFGPAMAKLSANAKTIEREDGSKIDLTIAMDKKRRVDTAYEIYLGLYQAVTGPEERQKLFKEFSPGFFDLIVIDECHRGSAADDSAWREILEHFTDAAQIGLTATPKETTYASNIDYFGKPAYSYTLKQGIRDGFLAPYKVIKVHIDRDVEGYRPEKGQVDRDGVEIEDRIYNTKDFDRTLVLDDRTKLVAKKVTEFLKASGDRYQKTIVFCVDQEHAARMRQALINENADLFAESSRYVMRITGNDPEGQAQLGNFIDPESRYPVLVTTSRLLSTGVDAQTCRLIVLDRDVGSMTEFKQIVGRGTRVHEDTRKYFFTLMDFRGATNHFADPDFDGEPVQIYEPGADDPVTPPDDGDTAATSADDDDSGDGNAPGDGETLVDDGNDITITGGGGRRGKVYVDGVPVVIVAERVEYLDESGKLVTESLRDFTKNALRKHFASLDDFLNRWNCAERKQALIDELSAEGLDLAVIAEELGKDLDPFDLICHIAFDRKPLTRRERADNVQKRDVFGKYGDQARAVLDALLTKYADEGMLNLDDTNVLRIESNFPQHFRTRETADLFLALFIRLLRKGGVAAIVLPDGSLFGEGVKTRLKEALLEECNLHTIVRLPNSVFKPYASIGTNLLFFEKGEPTKDIWFYEHQVPEGQKAYSMTRPIRVEHFASCVDWWGGAERKGREEGPQAWNVSLGEVKARGFNLDFKNPHSVDADHGDPIELLAALDQAEAKTADLRDQLKAILAEALAR